MAGILLATYLTFAWKIDKERWYRAYAILQGLDISEILKKEQEAAALVNYEAVKERRALRMMENDYAQNVKQEISSFTLPPADPKQPPPPPPSETARISAYEKRVKDDTVKAQSEGLDEETRLVENMDPDQAKEVIRKLWKENPNRVLTMLLAMTDKKRGDILYAMEASNDAELKDLCEILQRIGDGMPKTSIIEKAAKES